MFALPSEACSDLKTKKNHSLREEAAGVTEDSFSWIVRPSKMRKSTIGNTMKKKLKLEVYDGFDLTVYHFYRLR
eukprot:snap_masked-scaffold_13-processed-gene-11.25-mRNA-1 protein AED:1.00 eAED:1.00 QI:0/0/0/0/1/1/2/0/73